MPMYCCLNPAHRDKLVSESPVGGERIAASVGAMGANRLDDTKIVQTLLNACQATCAGSWPRLVVDGRVGPLTVAAIRAFQTAQFGTADGRVDPDQRTIARLNVLATSLRRGGRASGTEAAGPGTPPAGPILTPLLAAGEAMPRAALWIGAAMARLSGLIPAAATAGGHLSLLPSAATHAFITHFHLDQEPAATLSNLVRLSTVFGLMQIVLANPSHYFTEGPATADSPFADAGMGGMHLRGNKITFRTHFAACGPNTRSAMLIHELAHFCGAHSEIRHFAKEFPFPNGTAQDGSPHDYAQMTASEAMCNASSYAAFAIHCYFGVDHRYGGRDISL